MTLFHYFAKQVPFTEVERIMLATVCLYLACKVDFNIYRMSDFMRYYHENKKGPKKRKPFDEVAEQLLNDFTEVELKTLKIIQFDFNFELPYAFLREFRDRHLFNEVDDDCNEDGFSVLKQLKNNSGLSQIEIQTAIKAMSDFVTFAKICVSK